MRRRTWERAGAVACVTAALIVASQVLATEERATPRRPAAPTEVRAEAPAPAPSTTTTEALPPIAGPVRLDERTGLDGRGIGPVEAGMTVGEAEQAAGRRFRIVDRDGPGDRCYGAVPEGLVGLRFVVQGPADDARAGRITRVEVADAAWATVTGARVGQGVAEARKAYGRRLTGNEADGLLTVPVRDGGRAFAVGLVTSERGIVTQLRSGEAAAVAQPEGCS